MNYSVFDRFADKDPKDKITNIYKKKEKEGSETDKESVASSQFLEHLLEYDKRENRIFHPDLDEKLPKSFVSIRNSFSNKNFPVYNPNQKKTLEVEVFNQSNTSTNNVLNPQLIGTTNSSHYQAVPVESKNMSYVLGENRDVKPVRLVSRNQEKEELQRINDRFSSYIQHVRQLSEVSNQVDTSAFLRSTKILEEEINSLKNLYENELNKIRGDVDELVKEKSSLQLQVNKNKQITSELEDRLAIEMDRNRKLNDELNMYQRRVNGIESELNETKLSASRYLTDIENLQRQAENLTRENNSLKNRYDHEEMARQEDEDKIQQLMKKLEFNEQVHGQQAKELHDRLETSSATILSLEAKIRDMAKVDTNVSDLLRQVREASDMELRKYQEEVEERNTRNISTLKQQMNEDKEILKLMSDEKDALERLVGDLQNKIKSQDGEIAMLQHQKNSLEELLDQERSRAVEQTKLLERKLQELQEALFNRIQEANTARDINVPLKAEIEALKVLLEEEEKRLKLSLSTSNQIEVPSTLPTTTTNNFTSNYSYNSFNNHPKPITPPSTPIYTSKPYSPRALSKSYNSSIYPDTSAYVTSQPYDPLFSNVHTFLDEDIYTPEVSMPTDKYAYDSSPSYSRLQYEPQGSPSFGPVGPIRAKSAPAKQRGVQLVPTSLGQGQDYFDEMFKDLAQDTLQSKLRPKSSPVERIMSSSTHHDYTVSTSSAVGDIKILEVHPEGKYIRLVNEGQKDQEFGGYMIQQNVGGHPVAVYRFPPRLRFSSNTTITVWSAMNEAILHQPPTDFVWKEQQKWGTGPECTTILCKSNGQAIAWTTAAHRFTPNNYTEETLETSEQGDSLGEEESLTELPVDVKPEQVYLRREKQQPPSLSAQKHPHGSSSSVSTHPHNNGNKSFILGGNESNLRTSTRSQNRNDVIRNNGIQRSNSACQKRNGVTPPTIKGNGILVNKPENGSGRTSTPPNAFMKPKNRFATGITQIQSQHHPEFLPPMPKPPSTAAW